MSIDAFVMRYEIQGSPFTAQFLASGDFELNSLKNICKGLGFPANKNKRELIQQIAIMAGDEKQIDALSLIIDNLIWRNKSWSSIKIGKLTKFPEMNDPFQLIYCPGAEGWYGPINNRYDKSSATWYIRQKHIRHYEFSETEKNIIPVEIRWLIFARLFENVLSLHWRGFSYSSSESEAVKQNSQFEYWRYIPEIFIEIQELTKAKVEFLNLHKMILDDWWKNFRSKDNFQWIDRRIRAESSGVSLNAHAGAIYEIESGGIRNLATTIRRSIDRELEEKYGVKLPDPQVFEENILQTIIKEYGTLSYEFGLQEGSKYLFRAHIYFGQKGSVDSPDRFPHLWFHLSACDDKEQFDFLLKNYRIRNTSDANDLYKQITLFGEE